MLLGLLKGEHPGASGAEIGHKVCVLTLTSLSIYPLKSCTGIPLREARVEPLGLEHDRRWMAVRPDGSCMTGRELPALLLLEARPQPGGLRLSGPGLAALEVPLPSEDAPRLDVSLWSDVCTGALAGDAADRWLSAYLGEPARLVHVDARTGRQVDPRYAPAGHHTGFADGYPLLLTTEASLADLNARLGTPVEMARFRPNLVVGGAEPFAEDGWKRLRIGDVELSLVKPCARCVLVNVDPLTARAHPSREPLRTLATYRARDQKVMFGQNVLALAPGLLRVGATVEVLDQG